jgi:hypothetical protein
MIDDEFISQIETVLKFDFELQRMKFKNLKIK